MKRIIFYIYFIFVPISVVAEITLDGIINLYTDFFPEFNRHLNSTVGSSGLVQGFPINEQRDTIYIVTSESGGESPGTQIWKNDEKTKELYIYHAGGDTIVVEELVKRNWCRHINVYNELARNWETDVLKFIGEDNYFYGNQKEFLMRVVIEGGNLSADTTTYWYNTSFADLTTEQFDSIRQTYTLVNSTKLLVPKNNYKKYHPSPQAVTKQKDKSIWQRIADWFVCLWHSIFG